MGEPDATSATARRDWYRAAIAADPECQARFARSMERLRTTPGIPDDMDEIDRLLSNTDI